jgi:membrane-associated phospholipid phosphatase
MHYPSDVLAGVLVGWLAASLVVHLGRPSITRITVLVGRLTDPLVAPVWTRVASRMPSRRERESTT